MCWEPRRDKGSEDKRTKPTGQARRVAAFVSCVCRCKGGKAAAHRSLLKGDCFYLAESAFALFLQRLEGRCPCPCVCTSAVSGAAHTRAFPAALKTPGLHRSPGTPLLPRSAAPLPSPGSPAESSVAPQRALPAPSRPLEAAPAALHGGSGPAAAAGTRPRGGSIDFIRAAEDGNKSTALSVFSGRKKNLD